MDPLSSLNSLDTSRMFNGHFSAENEEAFNDLKAAIGKDISDINQAIQAAGTPAEDQDPDAAPLGADPSQG